MRQSAYDAYVTREPYWPDPPPQPRCPHCQAWLSWKPERTVDQEQTQHCDGKRQFAECVYTDADAGLLDIIGWDKLGQKYTVEYDSVCGLDNNHAPHEEVMWAWTEMHWTCKRCGKDAVLTDC